MDILTSGRPGKKLRQLILRSWRRPAKSKVRRSRSFAGGCSIPLIPLPRCRSWPDTLDSDDDWDDTPGAVAPEGYFAVYVGPDRKRFVIRTEYVNHPLFRMLLDEAEKEFGFNNEGPLTLPCDVSVFHRILWALDGEHQGLGPADRTSVHNDGVLESLNDKSLELLRLYSP